MQTYFSLILLYIKEAVVNVEFTYAEFIKVVHADNFQTEALNFFNRYTGAIEIVRQNTIEIVYFPILPYGEALENEQKIEWLQSLPVGKPRAKLDCFMENSLDYLQQLKNEYLFTKIFRYYPVFGALAKQIPLWRCFAFYLSIIINLYIMLCYRKSTGTWDDRMENPSFVEVLSTSNTMIIMDFLAACLTVFSGIIVMSFLYKYALSTYYRFMLVWEHRKQDKNEENALSKGVMMIVWVVAEVATNGDLLLNLANLILAFAGWFVHPFFFTFHLFNVAFRSKRLLNVLKAIVGPIVSISLTLMLHLVMEYLFAVIAYLFFPEHYQPFTCTSLLHCFLFNIDNTFKVNGGVGTALIPIYSVNEESQTIDIMYYRLIFDFLFGFILNLIIVQLLSGLIIDKFKSLRKETEKIEEDMRASCLICSESAEVIERKSGKTFGFHAEYIHNSWFYLMFIGFLLRKPKLDFSGIESYVYENFKKNKVDWLPYSLYFFI